MLVRLTPEQVSNFWEVVERPIESALPPIAGEQVDRMKNILVNILAGSMELWLSYSKTGDDVSINGTLLTTVTVDAISRSKDLLIYAIYGLDGITRSEWEDGYATIRKWAKVNDCGRIIAYTDIKSIINKAVALGGTANQVFITVPV